MSRFVMSSFKRVCFATALTFSVVSLNLSVLSQAVCAQGADGASKASAGSTTSITSASAASATPATSASEEYKLEPVAEFNDMMPKGVAISKDKRVFVCFPRHEYNGAYTVGELKDGKISPYPDAVSNQWDAASAKSKLVSILAVGVDQKNRLWLLDCGRVEKEVVPGAPKLVAIDLNTGAIVKTIGFTPDVFLPTTVLKDFRIAANIGKDGTAIIADSAPLGKSGLIVVDLESGKSIRRLSGHQSVTAEQDYVVFAEGEMVRLRFSEDNKVDWAAGVCGLALSADQSKLYYSPLAGLKISSISVPALCDPKVSEVDAEKTIKSLAREIGTSDGLESDSLDRLYLTDVENNEIWRRDADGKQIKLVRDERLIWPDRLALSPDGYLYVTASQFHRGPWFHYGKDLREKPFHLYRIKVDATPVGTHELSR